MSSDEHILVTGGAGFIGSHLTERLLHAGASVTVIDDFSTGHPANLARVENHRKLQVVESKVSACRDLKKLVSGCGFVFHLAAAVGVELVVKSPIRAIETNLKETEAMLEAASHGGVPLLLASTSEVYGKSRKEAFSEEDDLLIGPPHLGRWSYACSKLMDEFLAMAYAADRQLPVIIARLFNTVGPRQTGRYGMVLPRFLKAALSEGPLVVFGTGQQSRCFCYVRDTVEALIRLKNTPEAVGEIFNIGSTEEISILDLARRVARLLNSRSEIQFKSYAEAYAPGFQDLRRRKPITEKLARFTGFQPQTGIETIIRHTIEAWRTAPWEW